MKPKQSININMKPSNILKGEKLLLNISEENQAFIRNLNRKFTYNPKLFIPNFVPVLRPKPNNSKLIPSKLMLNNKRRNSSTISNPSSEDSDNIDNEELNLTNSFEGLNLSDSSSDSKNEKNNEINDVRKNFSKIRKFSFMRNKSKENANKKFGKMYLDKEIFNKENKKLFLMQKKSIETLSSLKINENMIINAHHKKPKYSMNSNSILETLQNKFNFEK